VSTRRLAKRVALSSVRQRSSHSATLARAALELDRAEPAHPGAVDGREVRRRLARGDDLPVRRLGDDLRGEVDRVAVDLLVLLDHRPVVKADAEARASHPCTAAGFPSRCAWRAAASAAASGVARSTISRSLPESITRRTRTPFAVERSLSRQAVRGASFQIGAAPARGRKAPWFPRSSCSDMGIVCLASVLASMHMAISSEQIDAYKKADYVVFFRPARWCCALAGKNAELDELISTEGATTAAFITAANPRGDKRSDTENGVANAALQSFVSAAGYPHFLG